MPGALAGVRIIDATSLFAGPLATMMLADQGADVIKVEPPGGQGDLLRKMGILHQGVAATFHAVNRNKRSIVLNLRDERGQAILHRLIRDADVFIHSFRPGVAARLGIDDPGLRAVRDDLIHVSLTGWGETGPLAARPGAGPAAPAIGVRRAGAARLRGRWSAPRPHGAGQRPSMICLSLSAGAGGRDLPTLVGCLWR